MANKRAYTGNGKRLKNGEMVAEILLYLADLPDPFLENPIDDYESEWKNDFTHIREYMDTLQKKMNIEPIEPKMLRMHLYALAGLDELSGKTDEEITGGSHKEVRWGAEKVRRMDYVKLLTPYMCENASHIPNYRFRLSPCFDDFKRCFSFLKKLNLVTRFMKTRYYIEYIRTKEFAVNCTKNLLGENSAVLDDFTVRYNALKERTKLLLKELFEGQKSDKSLDMPRDISGRETTAENGIPTYYVMNISIGKPCALDDPKDQHNDLNMVETFFDELIERLKPDESSEIPLCISERKPEEENSIDMEMNPTGMRIYDAAYYSPSAINFMLNPEIGDPTLKSFITKYTEYALKNYNISFSFNDMYRIPTVYLQSSDDLLEIFMLHKKLFDEQIQNVLEHSPIIDMLKALYLSDLTNGRTVQQESLLYQEFMGDVLYPYSSYIDGFPNSMKP